MVRLCSVVLVLGMVASALTQVQAADERRIGVVNVSRVFNAYQKVKDVQERMEKLFEAERNNIQKEGLDLKKWQDRLSVETRDPKKDMNLFKELQRFELAKMELDVRFQNLALEVEKKRKEEMKVVLNDIKASIRAVGTGDKFDLVLRAPEFEDEFDPAKQPNDQQNEMQSAAELVRKFRENPVLFFNQGVDVTQKVIDKLNADYKAAGPATPAAPK